MTARPLRVRARTPALPWRHAFQGERAVLALRVFLIVAMSAALALSTDAFLATANVLNVLRQASLMFLLAAGLTLVILCGGFDLSVAANLTLSACLAASVVKSGASPWLGIAAALAAGTLAGVLNGLAITLLRLPAFLATYAMLWILQGIAFHYMGGQEIYGFPQAFRALGTGFVLGIPVPVYLMAAVLVAGTLFLRRTNFGQEIYAIGANPEAARLSGIPVRRRQRIVYALCGLLSGLAAAVYLARVNAADSGMGEPLLLPVIAVAVRRRRQPRRHSAGRDHPRARHQRHESARRARAVAAAGRGRRAARRRLAGRGGPRAARARRLALRAGRERRAR